jgi:hypothetical protein
LIKKVAGEFYARAGELVDEAWVYRTEELLYDFGVDLDAYQCVLISGKRSQGQ